MDRLWDFLFCLACLEAALLLLSTGIAKTRSHARPEAPEPDRSQTPEPHPPGGTGTGPESNPGATLARRHRNRTGINTWRETRPGIESTPGGARTGERQDPGWSPLGGGGESG